MAPPQVDTLHLDDGSLVLRSRMPLAPAPDTIFSWLDRWAALRPDQPFVTEPRAGGGRSAMTYADTRAEVERLATYLAERGVAAGARVVLALPNSLVHLLWGLAVMRRGAVYVPMAPQYVGDGHDRHKLLSLLEVLDPALVICGRHQVGAVPPRWTATDVETLSAAAADTVPRVDLPTPGPQDVAKILLTSGSTGLPKPVPYTHRLMTTAMTMTLQVWPFARRQPPVLLDWLPWNHAFGGTANLHLVLAAGGTFHIDAGGPGPDGLDLTLAGVTELRPDMFFAVPATLNLVRDKLLADPDQAHVFFSSVRMIFSAGAALSATTFHALKDLADRAGSPVVILSGWGATETGPGATLLHTAEGDAGWIGTPLPGVEIKLTPHGTKQQASVRGPNVFQGYWGATAPARPFDADGFYITGDAARLVDPARPELGLCFDGRLADDFKLANGTWVDYAQVRSGVLRALGGWVVDVVIGMPDGPTLSALAWTADGAPLPSAVVSRALATYNDTVRRPSDRVSGLATLRTRPEPAEISTKGQLKPAEVRRARSAEFEAVMAARTLR